MQTLTFTQKLLRQRSFLSALIPLFALFVGLGASQSALAQGVVSDNVTLNVRGTTGTYDTQTTTPTGPTVFNGNNFGSFNLANASNVFTLNGTQLTINDPNGDYDDAQLIYRISPTAGPNSPVNTIQLGQGSLSGGVRTFTVTGLNTNLLAGLTAGNYNFQVRFTANDNNNGNPQLTGGPFKTATFTVTGAPAPATNVSNTDVFVNTTTGGNTGANQTYGASSGATPLFNGANLGSFNNVSGQLFLNGGDATTFESGGDMVQSVALLYTVAKPGVGANPTITYPQQSITLAQGTPTTDANGNITRTFNTSTALRNIIAQVASSGAGAYTINVSFAATVNNSIGTPRTVTDNNGGAGYQANFTITAIAPSNIGNSDVFINTTGTTTPNTTYGASSANTPTFQGANLGAYNINTGQLTLNGGDATVFVSGADAVNAVRLVYRITKPAANGTNGNTNPQPITTFPSSNIALTQLGNSTSGNGGTTTTYSAGTALRNLIVGLANSGTGTYNITVSFEADLNRNGSIVTVRDDNGGAGYTAFFTTIGIPIQTDTWTGAINDDWFNPGNWDLNRIPDIITNVIVPDFGVGNTRPYPNIYSGASYTASNGAAVNNTNSGPALSRDVTLQGTSQAQRSILRLIAGRWRIAGTFNNVLDSYIQRSPSILEFAGTGNQAISGGTFTRVEISGGGTKALSGVMTISESLTFQQDGGMLTTDISRPDANFVTLGGRATNAPDGAQLIGEADAFTPGTTIPSYIRGFVRTSRADVRANETVGNVPGGTPDPRTFGNIGMEILFTGTNDPGDVDVTRNTAESYTPLVTANATTTARYGIRRIFGVRPTNPATNQGGLVGNIVFTYLDSETRNLGPGANPTGSVDENNLALFVSSSSGNQFGFLGVDNLDTNTNRLTKNGVRTFATFTLGDRTAPLPVSLTGFDAKRVGNDALVTWETATEQNSRGFDVQVSTNGEGYRSLGFVASTSPNSIRPNSYSYVDVEKNKAGKRYYRLRQVDVDGKETFFAPRVVSFDGQATEVAMTAYPNPFGNADQLHLTLQSAAAGESRVSITDMTGRTVSQQKVTLTSGSNDVTVNSLGDLKGGLYIIRITLPTGEVKSLKVQKQ